MVVSIIGIGLIGGSFAISLREHGLVDEILGCDNSETNQETAIKMGIVDRVVGFEEAVTKADLIVVSIPVDTMPTAIVKILNRITNNQTVIDMGSTKQELCEMVSMHANRGRFVATHPMWGTEHSGPEAAVEGAFKGRTVVICEKQKSDKDALDMVEHIYSVIGMPITYMDAEEHDIHTAYVSHISHITSFALALTVLEKERESEHILDLAGGGFESTVRLAKSSSVTWVPILMQNKYNVLDVLREHIHQLQVMRKHIERDEVEDLANLIKKANTINKII